MIESFLWIRETEELLNNKTRSKCYQCQIDCITIYLSKMRRILYNCIQLPHHGKLSQAEDIFAIKDNNTIYFVSDNTGDSNGGSSKLTLKHKRGHVIYNTLSGDQPCTASSFKVTASVGSYLWG